MFTAKDETRKVGKKCRTFWNHSVVVLLAFRILGGGANEFMLNDPILKGHLMGINPFRDAGTLIDFLRRLGDQWIPADVKEWDISQQQTDIMLVNVFFRLYYYNGTEEEHLARETLLNFLAVLYCILTPDELYELNGIMPSGCPWTTLINCFINKCKSKYCYIDVMTSGCAHMIEYSNQFDLDSLFRETDEVVLGDDIVSNPGKTGVTQIALVQAYAKINMKLTSDIKDEPDYTTKHFTQCSIVGRTPRFDDIKKKWVLALREDTIINMICWKKANNPSPTPETDVFNDQLRESSLKGLLFFEKIKACGLAACVEFGLPYPKNLEWSDVFDETMNLETLWGNTECVNIAGIFA
jgi:hypothetical protein